MIQFNIVFLILILNFTFVVARCNVCGITFNSLVSLFIVLFSIPFRLSHVCQNLSLSYFSSFYLVDR